MAGKREWTGRKSIDRQATFRHFKNGKPDYCSTESVLSRSTTSPMWWSCCRRLERRLFARKVFPRRSYFTCRGARMWNDSSPVGGRQNLGGFLPAHCSGG